MNNNTLGKKLVNEGNSFKSTTDFWEERRFVQAADEFDYCNYYSSEILKPYDFTSLVDLLYSLDNYHMLMLLLVRHEEAIIASPICEA